MTTMLGMALYLLQVPHVMLPKNSDFLEREDKEMTLLFLVITLLVTQNIKVWLEYNPIFKWMNCNICKKQGPSKP